MSDTTNQIVFDTPISIGGRTAIITPDLVSLERYRIPANENGAVQIADPTPLHQSIWVGNKTIDRLREQHPGVPIFGLWQVLLANGRVNLSHPCSIFFETEGKGFVLACEGDRAMESYLFRGRMPDELDFFVEDSLRIDTSASGLVLPKSEIKTPRELGLARDRMRKAQLVVSSLGIAGILVLAYIVDAGLDHRQKKILEDAAALSQQATGLQLQAVTALKTRNTITQADKDRVEAGLTRLAELLLHTKELKTTPPLAFADSQWKLTSKSFEKGLSFPILMTGAADGTISFTMSPDGMGDQTNTPDNIVDALEGGVAHGQ